MHILQISPADQAGGAERVAWQLFQTFRRLGHHSRLAVSLKRSDDQDVLTIPNDAYRKRWTKWCLAFGGMLSPYVGKVRGAGRLRRFFEIGIGQPRRWLDIQQGKEDYDFPGTWRLFDLPVKHPDIVHCHNLHGAWLSGGGYFDLRVLSWLSNQVPVVLTLHDAWLLSGHCAHSFDCERWKIGCGYCPDLTIDPAINRDATAYNWQRKREIYAQSRLYVATPSRWLMQKVEQSMLSPVVVAAKVIPNGVDLSVFHPDDRRTVRAALGIRQDAKVLLFTAHGIRRNVWKDYQTIRAAVARVAERLRGERVVFLALGEDAPEERIGRAEVHFIPYQNEPHDVARYYQAADVYLHAARADTFPTSILEALACGTPVVATAVGGIPEQVEDARTGFLVPAGDVEAMASRLIELLSDDGLRKSMGAEAAEIASRRFDLRLQADTYLDWYQEIVNRSP